MITMEKGAEPNGPIEPGGPDARRRFSDSDKHVTIRLYVLYVKCDTFGVLCNALALGAKRKA